MNLMSLTVQDLGANYYRRNGRHGCTDLAYQGRSILPLPSRRKIRIHLPSTEISCILCVKGRRQHLYLQVPPSMDLNNPMHAGQWDPDKLPAGGTDDYFIDFLLDQIGMQSAWNRRQRTGIFMAVLRAEPKTSSILGETPVEGYVLATGYGGNESLKHPANFRETLQNSLCAEKDSIVRRLGERLLK